MKVKHICIFIISFFIIGLQAQDRRKVLSDSVIVKKDTISIELDTVYYDRNLVIGVDLMSPMQHIWDDSFGAEIMLSTRVYRKFHAVVELGYQQDSYKKVDWDVDVKGMYAKVGTNWSFKESFQQTNDFFYVGGRIGWSMYQQDVNQYKLTYRNPDGTLNTQKVTTGLPSTNLSAAFLEAVVGARVELWNTNVFLDTSLRPKVLVYTQKQDDIEPMVIPGFGKNMNRGNLWINVSLAYNIPISKAKKSLYSTSKK